MYNTYHRMVTQLYDIEKVTEGSRTDNILQHGYSMLVLWRAHELEDGLAVVYT